MLIKIETKLWKGRIWWLKHNSRFARLKSLWQGLWSDFEIKPEILCERLFFQKFSSFSESLFLLRCWFDAPILVIWGQKATYFANFTHFKRVFFLNQWISWISGSKCWPTVTHSLSHPSRSQHSQSHSQNERIAQGRRHSVAYYYYYNVGGMAYLR